MKKYLSIFLAAVLALSVCVFSQAYTDDELADLKANWGEIKADSSKMLLTPGADETEINFCWLSASRTGNELKISKSADMSGAKSIEVKSSGAGSTVSNKATATGLDAGETYYYQYTCGGESKSRGPYPFTTDDGGSFKVMVVSDSQIGRSGDEKLDEVLMNDTYGWNRNLENAAENFSDISFIISTGDQVETGSSGEQYNLFRYPDELRSIPVAPVLGNHDFMAPLYSKCFNTPNGFNELLPAPAGDTYYFSYNGVLFISMNSNNFSVIDASRLLKAATREYPDAEYKVVMIHNSIYSAGQENGEPTLARAVYAPVFDAYGVDLVLSGHTHTYTLTHPIYNGQIVGDGEGTVYLESSSASGSNYRSPKENTGDFVAASWQERVPTYSILEFNGGGITVNTYRCDTSEAISAQYTVLPDKAPDSELPLSLGECLISQLKAYISSLFN